MFKNRVSLFKLFDFQVWVDVSWIVIAVLVTWSLAVGFFPFRYKDLSQQTYWLMGVAGAMGLFGSIIFHELSHSLVARRYGLPIKGITLFIFGGVAEMSEESPSAKAEFMMAVAGPLSSIVLALGFYGAYQYTVHTSIPITIKGVFHYLGLINGLLAAFNLIPGFPLDGGRVLRSALWAWKNNLKWATNIASKTGSFFGSFLIILGLINVITGSFIGGMWWFLIGIFLRNAASASYQQVLIKQYLAGEPVRRFMNQEIITVPPTITVEELVEDYVYKYHYKMFPVLDGRRLLGCMSTEEVRNIPKSDWSSHRVGDMLTSCSRDNTIGPEDDAVDALAAMNRSGESRLLVVDGDELLGLISLRDLLKFLSLKLDLEGE